MCTLVHMTVVVHSCLRTNANLDNVLFLPVSVHPQSVHVVRGFCRVVCFLVVLTPRPRSEPVAAVAAAHWRNIQLTRVELSTLDATTRIEESCR